MPKTTTGHALHRWRAWAIQLAESHNIDPYEVDWFLQGLTPLTSTTLKLESYLSQSAIPLKASLNELTAKWNQRISDRTPVQYLVGETPWRNFTLTVTPDVLIPRPETELIIDIVKALVEESPIKEKLQQGHWADLGTGSGAIALGLAQTFPNATIHATDISEPALTIAKHNAKQNNLSDRITFHQGSWLTPFSVPTPYSPQFPHAPTPPRLSGIITNPPYIPSQTVPTLQPEVTNHEPYLALDGGSDGLICIKNLITNSHNYLPPGGLWLTELMEGQAQSIADLLTQQNTYAHITIHPDLAGIARFVSAHKTL
ncbi:MAG: peptide chain release factor N(5)-glutamine methyltransferase [Cyanobacteria bacterium J06648_10]